MTVIKYLFGIIFILSGMRGLFTGSVIAGTLLIILGIVILPPISTELSHKLKFWNNRTYRYGLYFIFLLCIGVTIEKPRKKIENPVSVANMSLNTNPEAKVKSYTKTANLQKEEIDIDNSSFWKEFDPIVKERVYKLIKEKDCEGLQKEFDLTADNMDKLQANGKSGTRNLELMSFLENTMKELNCH